ncbi:hypothetical protein PybrP1_009927 [[Pythium] brassicae (nom. inval.)]|nr:hypothetical protein PybrP1_009927 [[Pythium] brassicae (nom. inval.)]
MEPLSVPLYQGFFPQLVLSVDELLAYRRLAKERVAQLARVVEDADCVYTWSDVKRASSAAGAKCQRATFVDVRPDSKAARASTLLKASVQLVDTPPEEVLAALARSRTKDLRRTLAYLHGDAFLDAQTLLTFPTASAAKKPAYSYRAIKWCALKSKRRGGGGSSSSDSSGGPDAAKGWKGLDFCFLEYAGRKKPRAGSSVLGFIVQEAVSPDREVPHLDAYGLSRAPLSRSGVIISRTHQSNIIRVTAVCQIDGALPAPLRLAMEEVLLESVAAIHRVKGLLERQRMGRLQYLEQWEWVANADRKACAVCLRSFYFHRKHHCQTCGEVVCSTCAPLRELEEPLFDAARIRVCSLCLAGAAGSASVAASTERTSSNGGTDAYLRDLQQNPRERLGARELTRQHQRPTRLLGEADDADDDDDDEHGLHPSTLRASDFSFGGRPPTRAALAPPPPQLSAAKSEALSKLAYHMQQIRETINVAVSDADISASPSGDDMYDKILRIRDTLDISSPEFDAVLAALGSSLGARSDDGGGGSEDYYRYSSSSGGDRSSSHSGRVGHDDHFLFFSSDDQRSASSLSSLSHSSRDSASHASRSRSSRSGRAAPRAAAAAAAMQEETARYYARHPDSSSSSSRGGRSRRSPAHKDSLYSDQTAASSASKQSSDGKPPRVQLRSEHVVQLDNTRGIHRLAQKIEKLQQRLDDSHRAASVVSSSDLSLESEPEPELQQHQHQLRHGQYTRGRRSSYVETKPPASESTPIAAAAAAAPSPSPARKASSSASSSASAAHSTSQMVQALRGVMESSELTQAPPAWRKSFSSAHANSNDASSSASSSSRLSAASLAAHTRRSSASPQKPSGADAGKVVLGLPPRGGRQSSSAHAAAGVTTMFVYDEDSVNRFQRLSIEQRAPVAPTHPEADEEHESDYDSDDGDEYDDAYGAHGEHEPQFVSHDGDEEFSISSSEDGFSLPRLPSFSTGGSGRRSRGGRRSLALSGGNGRDREADERLRLYPPSSPSLGDSIGDSFSEYDDNVASLPSSTPSSDLLLYEWPGKHGVDDGGGESDSSDATRRLIEDVSKLPARMRTSSGQSSGAPSQENHLHHDF